MFAAEPNLPRTVYEVVWSLLRRRIFSPRPENVMLERLGGSGEDIYPCGRSYGGRGLDLSQLEWAANAGHFWFAGPVTAIKIIMDKGSIQGDLRLEPYRMVFAAGLNVLNYRNFEAVSRRLRETAYAYGVEVSFQQQRQYLMALTVTAEQPLSAANALDFVDKIHILHDSTDE